MPEDRGDWLGMVIAQASLLVKRPYRLVLAPSKPKRVNARGFTLIELMAVITIIGIFAAVAMPSFIDQMRDRRVNDATLRIAGLYRLARTKALASGRATRFLWDSTQGTQGYVWVEQHPNADPTCDLTNWPAAAPTNSNAVAYFNSSNGRYELANITLYSPGAAAVAAGQVCFTPLGRAYFGGTLAGPLTPLVGVASMKVTNTKTGFLRQIFMPPSGAARVEL